MKELFFFIQAMAEEPQRKPGHRDPRRDQRPTPLAHPHLPIQHGALPPAPLCRQGRALPDQAERGPAVHRGARLRRDPVLHVAAHHRLQRVRLGLGPLPQDVRGQLLLR